MTASLIFIEKDANFTEGGDMNSGPLGKICCSAVWDLKKVSPFGAGFFLLTVTSSLNNRITSYDAAAKTICLPVYVYVSLYMCVCM